MSIKPTIKPDELDLFAEKLIRAYELASNQGEFCIVLRTIDGDARNVRAIYRQIGAVAVAQFLNRAADMIFDGTGTIETTPDERAN